MQNSPISILLSAKFKTDYTNIGMELKLEDFSDILEQKQKSSIGEFQSHIVLLAHTKSCIIRLFSVWKKNL